MAKSIIAPRESAADAAPRAFTSPSMLRGGSPQNAAICVLNDALLNLTDHFRDDGMPAREASELAHKALQIDATAASAAMLSVASSSIWACRTWCAGTAPGRRS